MNILRHILIAYVHPIYLLSILNVHPISLHYNLLIHLLSNFLSNRLCQFLHCANDILMFISFSLRRSLEFCQSIHLLLTLYPILYYLWNLTLISMFSSTYCSIYMLHFIIQLILNLMSSNLKDLYKNHLLILGRSEFYKVLLECFEVCLSVIITLVIISPAYSQAFLFLMYSSVLM